MDREGLLDCAKEVENYFHGATGSGLDVTASCLGGVIQYQKDTGCTRLSARPFFKLYDVLLIDTRVKK